MNFRASIKQVLARVRVAEKKKDLKVIVPFKKELAPFLTALVREGVILQFRARNKTLVLHLKKSTAPSRFDQKQKVVRDFDVEAVLYKNPVALVFISTTRGVCTKNGQQKIGGTRLFVTY